MGTSLYNSESPVLAQRRSLLDQLKAKLFPSAAAGGLLSQGDVSGAQGQGLLGLGAALSEAGGWHTGPPTGLFQALGQGVQAGQQAYQGALDKSGQRALAGQTFDKNKMSLDQAKKQDATRAAVLQKFPPPTDHTNPAAMMNWIQSVVPELLLAGNEEDAKALLDIQASITKANEGQAIQTGDQVTTFVPGKGFWDAETKSWVPSITRGMNADQLAEKSLDRQVRMAGLQAQQLKNQQTLATTQTNNFMRRNKDVVDQGSKLNQALLTLKDAVGNPALYTSSIVQFISVADQKAQVRQGILDFFKDNPDPSLRGRWDVIKARLLKGQFPPRIQQALLAHVQHLFELNTKEYQRRYAAEVKRHPVLEGYLPQTDEYFHDQTVGPDAVGNQPGGGLLNKYDQED